MASSFECNIEVCCRKARSKGLCSMHYQRMWKHGSPHIRKSFANGEGGISSQGYRVVSLHGRRILEHVALAERAIGRGLPNGAEVHHVNGNKLDNTPRNLVVCPNPKYHQLLHRRTKALEECGNADHRKCWICGLYDSPGNLLIFAKSSPMHATCRAQYRSS